MHDGGTEPEGGHPPPTSRDGRRVNTNYRYFGTILFLGALAMILLMVLLHR